MNNKYLFLSKCIVNAMFMLGIPCTLLVPFFLKWYGRINTYYAGYFFPIQTVMFMIMGVFSCLILFELRGMLKTVEMEDCFVRTNVMSLDRMGWFSFIIAIVSAIRFTMYITPGCFIVVAIFLVAGLFSKVLARVFEKAIEYKEDNDLTI